MTSAGKDVPGGSAPANPPRANPPPLQRRVVSRLLGPGANEAAQQKLVYSIEGRQAVLVELNLPSGAIAEDMREQFRGVFHAAFEHESEQPPEPLPISSHYMRCLLTPVEVTRLAQQDAGALAGPAPAGHTIYRIWPDFIVHAHIDRSLTTIKSDAAARTYGTSGDGVVWAVVDSGIDQTHPHFAGGTVTDPAVAHLHRDFTGLLAADGKTSDDPAAALADPFGHGTHVAGIIAGAAPADPGQVLIATNKPTNFRLRVEPQDLRFRAAIAAAGVTVDAPLMEDVLSDTIIDTPADPSIEHSYSDDSSDPYAAFKPRKD